MLKVLGVCITGIITSFYFFPVIFTFFPIMNTKTLLAACGLIMSFFGLAKHGRGSVNKDFAILTLFACGVSLATLISMVFNDTPDDTYLSYVISFWVWTGGAYVAIVLMKTVHHKVSMELVCYYLIAVCAAQCIIAILIDTYLPIKSFVDSFCYDASYMVEKKRLYGIGCGLDIAGGRFAAILIIISFLLPQSLKEKNGKVRISFLLLSFGIIAVIGNIIGRTTTIGMVMAIGVIIYMVCTDKSEIRGQFRSWVISFAVIAVVVAVCLYYLEEQWRTYLEFGFEGFFSLVEKGRWEVHSNEMLKEGLIFPEGIRQWLIGDGYFGNTDVIDPYYTGKTWYGFYKGTDAGYSRFLFYFGLIGLGAFAVFLMKVTQVCMHKFPRYKYMFLMVLAFNFIYWVKVSTDIFLVFAPFLCLPSEEKEVVGDSDVMC